MSADSKLMQEIDKLYHLNQNSEGRINHITDFVSAREAALQARVAELEACLECAKECIDEMAYQANNADISDVQKLKNITAAWMNCEVLRIAAALESA
jgi:hypothetical protein